MTLGFGVTSTIDLALVQRLGPRIEEAGFSIFWSNDIPGGSSFDVLAACAGVTLAIKLANGIVPIDRVPAAEWRDRLDRAGLLGERMYAGIGSGQLSKPLDVMGDAVSVIREDTGRPVIVGALRANMRRFAAEQADGVLLNWLTPEFAAIRQQEMAQIYTEAGRTDPFLSAAFVRVAIGEPAIDRLRHEAAKYESFPSYAKHFAEMGVSAFDTAIAANTVEEAADGLTPFLQQFDHPVLRCVVAEEDDDAYLQLIEAGKLAVEQG
ncbi:MAG: LLM class flavin-dependent oxidoreductase [Chloroflexia bacterium]|jgi:alkanesulfonate monooxygenase SsuD/methylene tetrahydromethanopterin reductase-like flavin-dependent oxidoreductase (luciferase family)|nr:LLM class flavin-dependent oxidoreductase [Chloroflexia bacterium]MDQ3614489.1 LLM class flavin-dependent oxidoreductase [Chloroflexota bacterium]